MPSAINLFGQEPWELRGTNDARIRSLETRATALEADTGWIAPTLLNGWTIYGDATFGNAAFYRRFRGVVYLRGLLESVSATNPQAFTLPAGFQPATITLLFATLNSAAIGRWDVQASGAVVAGATGHAWNSLNGIQFVAEK
jgi:hypothetical protein